jgi:hypothetical protein
MDVLSKSDLPRLVASTTSTFWLNRNLYSVALTTRSYRNHICSFQISSKPLHDQHTWKKDGEIHGIIERNEDGDSHRIELNPS